MNRAEYTVDAISGDYAVLLAEDGERSKLALALLPADVEEGDTIVYENFQYSKR